MTPAIARPDGARDLRIRLHPPESVFLDSAADGWLNDTCPMIAADSRITAEELAWLLRRAYFCPSEDAYPGSYETRSAQFNDSVLHLALKHVASADRATRTAITQALWREIHWLIPKDRTVDIAVRRDVTLRRPAGSSPSAGNHLTPDASLMQRASPGVCDIVSRFPFETAG